MRVALIAESFLPHMNGVTGSVLQVIQHLRAAGHDTLVVAPRAETGTRDDDTALIASIPLPTYPEVRVAVAPVARIRRLLDDFRPDVVHLASPFVLGWQALVAADSRGYPTVAIYQTDVISYTQKYGVPGAAAMASSHVARLHRRATLTLAPSSAAQSQLEALGVDRIWRWGRGVDTDRFRPDRRSDAWRSKVAPAQRIVGYVGRLAPEKQVADLAAVADLPDTRLVIVGDGPERARLEALLPQAHFTGFLHGTELATAIASFDVFVHPGESETFCQTVQEAMASAVPVVATGAGGPIDLVHNSIDGWLYRPGDLADLRARVSDLLGDEAKRRSFAQAALQNVADRSWHAMTESLIGHYREAIRLHHFDEALLFRGATRPLAPTPLPQPRAWGRYVALGDSLTEGLCDTSRMAAGQFRGWADRLAMLLAQRRAAGSDFEYANLAVRSRRVRDLVTDQVPAAIALRPEIVSILMGANDLTAVRAHPRRLAADVELAVRRLHDAGIDVMLVTPFLPRRGIVRPLARRFALFADELRAISARTGCLLLDVAALPELGERTMWAADKVHLSSRGHRLLAYQAAEVLGVPHAHELGGLEDAFHVDDDDDSGHWLRRHALPWMWRRVRGRTAGDGKLPKHADYVPLPGRSGGTGRAEHDPRPQRSDEARG